MNIVTLTLLALAATSQADRCAPNDGTGDMMCVSRKGHCAEVSIDGQATTALTDSSTAARVHEIPHGVDVCWQLEQPVSASFRVRAKPGGINAGFLGELEQLRIVLFNLDDYDPELDIRLYSLHYGRLVDQGDGSWRLQSQRPLPAGEYVAVIRIYGSGNWTKQAVLLTLDSNK